MFEDVVVVLPSLNPDRRLVKVAGQLAGAGFRHIVIIDDGSDRGHKEPFAEAHAISGSHNLAHAENRGKGRALKTGFAFVLERFPLCRGVITVDGDGQHQIQDIVACGEALLAYPDSLVLGVRDFAARNAPLRSRFGNALTRMVFRAFCGMSVTDTQTGLRGIPFNLLRDFCDVEGERFEYETNVILAANRLGIPIAEVKISAVYLGKNETSHFRAVRDSIKVYGAIFPFMLNSLFSCALDISAFAEINYLLSGRMPAGERLFFATAAARSISASFNFLCNHLAVFRSKRKMRGTAGRYAALCLIQGTASYLLVFLITALYRDALGAQAAYKILVDIFLFFMSFQIQRVWVFGKGLTKPSSGRQRLG
jgi:glycosyltransferase involved in cell wall biosynthesis